MRGELALLTTCLEPAGCIPTRTSRFSTPPHLPRPPEGSLYFETRAPTAWVGVFQLKQPWPAARYPGWPLKRPIRSNQKDRFSCISTFRRRGQSRFSCTSTFRRCGQGRFGCTGAFQRPGQGRFNRTRSFRRPGTGCLHDTACCAGRAQALCGMATKKEIGGGLFFGLMLRPQAVLLVYILPAKRCPDGKNLEDDGESANGV